jgi:serine/threonine-protein kinase HipA
MCSRVWTRIFNWLIAGTDAHAKNYALLLGGGGAVRLAPLYDLASILPYQTVDVQKAKLAMKIGGEYRLRYIGLRNWKKFAVDLRLQEDWLIERIRAMAASLPDQAATIQSELEAEGLLHGTITRLARRLTARATSCKKLLLGGNSAAR